MDKKKPVYTVLLLTIYGTYFFQEEYTQALSVIETCILATDLELHFKHRDQISQLFKEFDVRRQKASFDHDEPQLVLMEIFGGSNQNKVVA